MTALTDQPAPVTIGICCFNAEGTIEAAVRSAMAQEWQHLEIIIVDDCSTDRSALVLNQFASIENIKIICHRENVGPAGSRNTILDNSSGKYIAFFDDDDTSDSMRIAQQVADIERQMVYFESRDVVTFCSGQRRYSPDFVIMLDAIGSQMQAKPSGSDVVDYLLFGRKRQGLFFGTGTPSCAMLAPVELLKRVGGFDKGFRRLEDAELCVRLAAHGTIFSGTPERVLFQNVSHALDKSAFKNLKAELKLVQKHRSLFRDQHQIAYAKRKHLLRYYYFRKNLTGALRTVAALQRNPAFSFVQDVFLPLIRRVKKDMKLG